MLLGFRPIAKLDASINWFIFSTPWILARFKQGELEDVEEHVSVVLIMGMRDWLIKELFPEPLTPVMHTNACNGKRTVTFRKLFVEIFSRIMESEGSIFRLGVTISLLRVDHLCAREVGIF